MKYLLFAFLLSAPGLFGELPKNIYIDKMGGFETFLADALKARELPVNVVLERDQPDLKVQLGKRLSGYAELIYSKQTGRRSESRLTVIDTATGKALLHFDFHLGRTDEARKRNAERFADTLRRKLK